MDGTGRKDRSDHMAVVISGSSTVRKKDLKKGRKHSFRSVSKDCTEGNVVERSEGCVAREEFVNV